MSVLVNELQDFTLTNYIGKYITMTAEDLKFIHSVVNWETPAFKHTNGSTFVLIFDETLIAIDRSYPFNRQILDRYNIKTVNPPLVNFDFDLVFIMKTGTNQPALKLSEVLTSIGYNGPRITDLKQVYMKKKCFKNQHQFMLAFRG